MASSSLSGFGSQGALDYRRRMSQAKCMTITNAVNPLIQPLGEMPPDAVVFGRTDAMQAVRDRLNKLAGANLPVLVQGESGAGKEIIPRMIFTKSLYRPHHSVKVKEQRLPRPLLGNELFGFL